MCLKRLSLFFFFIRFVWKGVEDGKIKMLVQVKYFFQD